MLTIRLTSELSRRALAESGPRGPSSGRTQSAVPRYRKVRRTTSAVAESIHICPAMSAGPVRRGVTSHPHQAEGAATRPASTVRSPVSA